MLPLCTLFVETEHDLDGIHNGRFAVFRRLSPFPFAGLPVVAGDMALDHFVASLIARHDEGSEVAAAEAKRCERHHYKDLRS